MGLFDKALGALGIGVSEQSASQQQQQERSQTQTQTERQTANTFAQQIAQTLSEQMRQASEASRSAQQEEQAVQTLDEQTQSLIRSLLTGIAGATQEGGLTEQLVQRAAGAGEAFNVAPILAEARQRTEEGVRSAETRFATEAGSSLNSLVQQLGLEERRRGETALGALAAQLETQARQAGTEEIRGAITTSQQQIAQLADILKGATTTGTTARTGETVAESASEATTRGQEQRSASERTQTSRQLEAALESILNATGTSSAEGYQDPIAGWINSAIGGGQEGSMLFL